MYQNCAKIIPDESSPKLIDAEDAGMSGANAVSEKQNVSLADNHPSIRESLAKPIDSQPDLSASAHAGGSVKEALGSGNRTQLAGDAYAPSGATFSLNLRNE